MENIQITQKTFEFIETGITTPNGIVPSIFGYEKTNSVKQSIAFNKDIYVLHLVLSGKGFLNGKPVTANQVFILTPNKKDIYAPDPEDPWSYLWIEFSGTLCESYLRHCGFNEQNHILTLSDISYIIQQFKDVMNEIPNLFNKHARNIQYEAKTMNIISNIIEQCGYLDKNKEKSAQTIVMENIITFINLNYSNPDLTVEFIAKQFSYVPSYLTRIFKNFTGLSPVKYITKIRMEKAVNFFEKGLNINKVSNIVGFRNQFYFSKSFTKYYGMRPSTYLKEKITN